MRYRIFAAALSIFLMLCTRTADIAGGSTTTTDNAKVSGCVFTNDGAPAHGAVVRLREKNFVQPIGSQSNLLLRRDTVTDDSGWFTIDSLKRGEYRIEINDLTSAAITASCRIDGRNDSVALPNDTLRPYTSIIGTVDSSLLGNAPLFVQIEGMERLALVDSAGGFAITDLPPGEYTVHIVSQDTVVAPVVIDSVVTDSGVTTVVVELTVPDTGVLHLPIGPWVEVNGPFFAGVGCMIADQAGNVFAGSQQSGVFRLVNNGARWEEFGGGPTGGKILFLAKNGVTSSEWNMLYAGTPYGIFKTSVGSGSVNRLWDSLPSRPPATMLQAIAVSADEALIFVGTGDRGLFRSIDGGVSWTGITAENGFDESAVHCVALQTNDNGGYDVFAGTPSVGIMRSIDSGLTWTAITEGLMDVPTHCITACQDGKRILAGNRFGVFASDDGGGWKRLLAREGAPDSLPSISIAANGLTVVAAFRSAGIFRSFNDGADWSPVNDGLPELSVNGVAIGAAALFAGTDRFGVYSCAVNGSVWSAATGNVKRSDVPSLLSTGTNLFALINGSGIFRSGDNGATWTAVGDGLPDNNIATLAAGVDSRGVRTVFAPSGDRLYSSADEGAHWTIVNTLSSSLKIDFIEAADSIFVAGYRTADSAGVQGGFVLSTDRGRSWQQTATGIPDAWNIYDIAVLPGRSGNLHLFAATGWQGLFRSSDNGAIWIPAVDGMTEPARQSIWSVAVTGQATGSPTVFAGTNAGVYQSSDYGATWRETVDGLPAAAQSVGSLFVHTYGSGAAALFAGVNGGVYCSTDDGTIWTLQNDNLLQSGVEVIAIHNSYLFIGSGSDGIWKAPLR